MTWEWVRIAARTIALFWAGWWLFFGLASGLGERLTPAGVMVHTFLPGGIFLVSALIPWRWEAVGGVLLVLEAVLIAVGYPILFRRSDLFVLGILALPPLLAGLLFLLDLLRRADSG